jgi:hypothetical protein
MNRSRLLLAAVGAVALALVAPTSTPAQGRAVVSPPIVTGLAMPLQIDVSNGTLYVTQATGLLTEVGRDGSTTDLASEPPGEARDLSGVAAGRKGIAYATTFFDPADREALLKLRKWDGSVRTVADLWAYEQHVNPDGDQTYGFLNLSKRCAAKVPAEVGGEPYTGIVDAHPYAIANAWDGGWYVADAGMNAILHVSKWGKVRTAAVLPPQPVRITKAAAKANGLPKCTVGKTYAFEPVPTDVEVGHGKLVVSLLPGGPEDPSLGARGAVYTVNPWSTTSRRIGSGFLGATNVAIGDHGEVYVAELFGNKVSKLGRHGRNRTVATLTNPASIEYSRGKLYVSYDVFANGSIAKIRLH